MILSKAKRLVASQGPEYVLVGQRFCIVQILYSQKFCLAQSDGARLLTGGARPPVQRYGPRPIDLDILLYGSLTVQTARLQVLSALPALPALSAHITQPTPVCPSAPCAPCALSAPSVPSPVRSGRLGVPQRAESPRNPAPASHKL